MAAAAIKKIMRLLERIFTKRPKTVPKSQAKMMQGTVVAVGAGARSTQTGEDIHSAENAGDRVLLPEFGGIKFEIEDKEEYLLFRESETLA